ncbi:MAG: ADP-ribosylglycohydrolase family protein [Selenomonadaceae bacterium]|nr:ADP-ribosylglycohydrolase family protein [Selenomonadaceae bacterium]
MEAKTIRGIILSLAVGDALGVPVEFSLREELKANPITGMCSGGAWNQEAGTWSDDTSLTLATMESITRRGKIDYNDIMENFLLWYEFNEFTANGECFDIGNTTRSALVRFSRHLLPATKCGANRISSNGNGSLLRIMPAVLYVYTKYGKIGAEGLKIVQEISALTHAHIISQMACGVYALIAAQLLEGKEKFEAFRNGLADAKKYYGAIEEFTYFERLYYEDFVKLPDSEISAEEYAVVTLEAALWCLLNTDDYQSLALKAVNLGEDSDTVAAVACALGGIIYGIEGIPNDWLDILKRRDYIEKICDDFAAVVNAAKQ